MNKITKNIFLKTQENIKNIFDSFVVQKYKYFCKRTSIKVMCWLYSHI